MVSHFWSVSDYYLFFFNQCTSNENGILTLSNKNDIWKETKQSTNKYMSKINATEYIKHFF